MMILDIYHKYKIMPFLQLHHFRVAAVASQIIDNFDEKLIKTDIISACLLHDIGNIVKFKLEYIPEAVEPEGYEYWKKIQEEFIEKWGSDEHMATRRIVQEVEVSDRIAELIEAVGFSKTIENSKSSDFEKKICCYCDHRVTPFGIASLEDRMKEGRKRFLANKGIEEGKDHFPLFAKHMRMLEKQIFESCMIKPKEITDKSVALLIKDLKEYTV